jgi:RNA polymerase sigma factor (sigma-70 family)
MSSDDTERGARVRFSDAEAFGLLFERYGEAIYAYCFRRTADADRAADLTSVTFLEAWRRRDVSLPSDKVLPWLFGVATNVLRNERRSRRRYKAALDRLPAIPDQHDFADEATNRIDDQRRMREALFLLGRLSRGERDLFILAAWQGLSTEDAAYALGISPGAARTRLSRARKRLAVLAGTEDCASSLTTKGVESP